MPRIIADISMSIDGFVTGPNVGLDNGLGDGGEPLHTWAIDSDDPVDVAALRLGTESSGSVIMGRRLFDIIDGPQGWDETMGYGAAHAATPPFIVVTHAAPPHVRLELDFTFVTDGIDAAVERARPAAGDHDVVIMGGGAVIRSALDADLIDELRIHLAPVMLGAGTPLFGAAHHRSLEQIAVQVSPHATHLAYRVTRS